MGALPFCPLRFYPASALLLGAGTQSMRQAPSPPLSRPTKSSCLAMPPKHAQSHPYAFRKILRGLPKMVETKQTSTLETMVLLPRQLPRPSGCQPVPGPASPRSAVPLRPKRAGTLRPPEPNRCSQCQHVPANTPHLGSWQT